MLPLYGRSPPPLDSTPFSQLNATEFGTDTNNPPLRHSLARVHRAFVRRQKSGLFQFEEAADEDVVNGRMKPLQARIQSPKELNTSEVAIDNQAAPKGMTVWLFAFAPACACDQAKTENENQVHDPELAVGLRGDGTTVCDLQPG